MSDEIGMVVAKGSGAENMIGMDMGQDHIPDRTVGARLDCRMQFVSLFGTPARIDHRYSVVSDNEADIGDLICICWRGLGVNTVVHKDPRGDLRNRQRYN